MTEFPVSDDQAQGSDLPPSMPALPEPNRTLTALAVAILGGLAGSGEAREPAEVRSLYLDYSPRPEPAHLLAHDLSIVNGRADCDLITVHQQGGRVLAYLSLVEIAETAAYFDDAVAAGIEFEGTNPEWDSHLVDITSPTWERFLVEQLAAPLVEKGFDGFFLDTADSHQRLAAADPARAGAFRQATIGLVNRLHERFPDASLVINRGFDLVPEIDRDALDGVLVESVFRTFDPLGKSYETVDPATSGELRRQISALRDRGLPVFVVDYLPPGDPHLADTERAIRATGAIPFLTTPSLDGTISAGGKVARRILVLFGHDPKEAETPRIWPADTTAYAILQTPLEYQGYELDYHDVGKGVPRLSNPDDYAGVILDEEIHLPYHQERQFADWLLERLDADQKVLFLGSYAFSDPHERERLFRRLGISGNENAGLPTGPASITAIDEALMNFEAPVKASSRDFENLSAPEGSRVLLSLGAELAPPPEALPGDPAIPGRYDAVYQAPWGGAMLSPYVVFEASEETVLQFTDPFAFLEPLFPSGRFPAPDPSTRDGLRVFYTHVDGDGFSSLTSVDPGKTCAEVLREQVLEDLPWPITISIVEAEIRGHMLSQPRGIGGKLAQEARKIFRLPHVEPASHSYSHPYLWIEDDAEFMGLYDSKNLSLKLQANYPAIDLERETIGSLAYITENLAPPGKPAELLLWSGNCRPSPEALRILRAQGFENLNGGNTILCRRFPGLFGVAPRTVTWDGELQVNAANQNEFMYTDGWEGPTWNGFAQVIETFEMTESPRRLKPVNVYYHFYSAERPDAFAALRAIYDWCRRQDLHAITALDYARSARDSHGTRLVRTGHRRWSVLNRGQLRTFRVPASFGLPDLALSRGVTGYRRQGDQVYVHTDGRRDLSLEFSDRPSPHVRLESASAELEIVHLSPSELHFQVLDRPAEIVLAGFAPGALLEIRQAPHSKTQRADAEGRLRMHPPASATLAIRQVSHP